MITRRSFETTAIRRHTLTERSLQGDGAIWEVGRITGTSNTRVAEGKAKTGPQRIVSVLIPYPSGEVSDCVSGIWDELAAGAPGEDAPAGVRLPP